MEQTKWYCSNSTVLIVVGQPDPPLYPSRSSNVMPYSSNVMSYSSNVMSRRTTVPLFRARTGVSSFRRQVILVLIIHGQRVLVVVVFFQTFFTRTFLFFVFGLVVSSLLPRVSNAGGTLGLSGVLEEQAEGVMDAFKDTFDLRVAETMGGWALISGVRRDS